jgi:hypothetical protein
MMQLYRVSEDVKIEPVFVIGGSDGMPCVALVATGNKPKHERWEKDFGNQSLAIIPSV